MKKIPSYAVIFAAAIIPLHAASDLTNPLNTYAGTSQDDTFVIATQPAFLTTPPSGLEVSHLAPGFTAAAAFETIFFNTTTPPVGEFPGAEFGSNRGNPSQAGGNDGRNYLRTVEMDYHTQDFTAFVTVRRPTPTTFSNPPANTNPNRRSVFFGLGTGARNSSGANPDAGTNNAAVYFEMQNGFNNVSRRAQGQGANLANRELGFNGMTTVQSDSIRMRMSYDSVTRVLTLAVDYDYVPSAAFVADQTFPAIDLKLVNVTPAYDLNTVANEWNAGDRSSIFFGGDRSVVFTDLVIDATQPAAPPIPTGLTRASFGDQTVSLTWSSFAIPGTTYNVYRSTIANDPAAIAIATGLTTTSYTDDVATNPGNAPANGTTYYYTVTQSNTVALAAESAKSNEISALPAAGALTPAGVIAVNGGKNALVVDWADLPSGHTYTVKRSTAIGGPFTIPTGGSVLMQSRFLDQTVVDGTTYFYTVNSTLGASQSPETVAVSAASRSLEVFVDFNNPANNTPTFSGAGAVIPAPVGTSWNGLGTGSVANLSDSTLALSSVGLNATGQGTFNKENGLNVGGDNTAPASATLTAAGGFDLMRDYIFQNGANATTTYTLTGLVPSRKYDLYLYGYGDVLGQNTLFGANSIFKQTSNPAGQTTLSQGRHFVTFTTVAALDGTVEFTWRSGFGTTDADPNTGSAIINGFQLVENAAALLQPLNLTAIEESPTEVTLNWDEVVGATTYKIYRSTTRASGHVLITPTPILAGGYVDIPPATGTYYYVITAGDGTVESFTSAEVAITLAPQIVDDDLDGLSNSDEALLGTDPNDAGDFFKAQTSTVTPSGANYNVSFVINGAPGTYVIERSTTLIGGSWTEIPSSSNQISTWSTGTVLTNPLTLSATGLTPAPGGKEFFRAKGIAPLPAP